MSYRFGLAFSTRPPTGFGMDIDRVLHIKTDKDNSRERQTAFNLAIGPRYSANEHLVPELMFDNPKTTKKEAEGVSAVKAIQLAAQQGQTIYTITNKNKAKVLPKLSAHSSETLTDVRNSLNQNKVVQIHEKPITYFGWNGAGYTLLDKVTGAGAYMIDGGTNGGFLNYINDNSGKFALAIGITGILASLGTVAAPILLAFLALSFLVAILVTLATNLTLIENGCPDSLVLTNSILVMTGFALSQVLKGLGTAIARAIATWVYTNIVPQASPLCRYNG